MSIVTCIMQGRVFVILAEDDEPLVWPSMDEAIDWADTDDHMLIRASSVVTILNVETGETYVL